MNRKLVAAGVGGLAIVAVVGFYFASPLLAVQSLKSAALEGNRDRLEQLVDFPAVRESLKGELNAKMAKTITEDPEMADNPFAGLAMMMVPTIVNSAVDAYATPEAIASFVGAGRAQGTETPEGKAAAKAEAEKDDGVRRYAYTTLDTFKIFAKPNGGTPAQEGAFVLRRQGLFGWKLVRFELPQDLS